MSVFDTWLKGQVIKDHITNPNIIVGDYSYYSGFYHQKSFEEQAVRYLLGDPVTLQEWQSREPDSIDKLIIGKFCSIASGTTFMMAGNQGHRITGFRHSPSLLKNLEKAYKTVSSVPEIQWWGMMFGLAVRR